MKTLRIVLFLLLPLTACDSAPAANEPVETECVCTKQAGKFVCLADPDEACH